MKIFLKFKNSKHDTEQTLKLFITSKTLFLGSVQVSSLTYKISLIDPEGGKRSTCLYWSMRENLWKSRIFW